MGCRRSCTCQRKAEQRAAAWKCCLYEKKKKKKDFNHSSIPLGKLSQIFLQIKLTQLLN